VRLVAVSKKVAAAGVREAADAGQLLFGENYLQEAQAKIVEIGPGPGWHFIGHLQTNKARQAAELFAMIETVDRLKLARALDNHLANLGRRLPVLVQVNVGREPQKAGVFAEKTGEMLREMRGLEHLDVKGLMTMPPFFDQPEAVRPFFRDLRLLAAELTAEGLLGRYGPVELSMGMSGDFEVAIEEGATLVRVGTALFGGR
jgi:PLP dependent protein